MTDDQIANTMQALGFAALCAIVVAQACTADAQPDAAESTAVRRALTPAVARPNGSPRRWCSRPTQGCTAYVGALAEAFTTSATRHDLDVWVLVAMASVESGFNPYAVGSDGELGVMQHHPRWHRGLEMARLGPRACQQRADVCQGDSIERAARSLARRIRVCRDLRVAVSGHNAGRCSRSPKARRYARRVFARRAEIVGAL